MIHLVGATTKVLSTNVGLYEASPRELLLIENKSSYIRLVEATTGGLSTNVGLTNPSPSELVLNTKY